MGISIKNSSLAMAAPLKQAQGFVEILGRSNFSFLQGASHPDEMVEEAIALKYNGLGLCDLNGLYGVVRGFQAVHAPSSFITRPESKNLFKYFIGTELTLTDETSLTLIPMNKQGYSHLCELLTLGKRSTSKGFSQISLQEVEKFSEGIMCVALPPWTEERYENLYSIFKDRLYLPVWRDLTWETQEYNQQSFALEKKYQAQLFVTQRPFMHKKEKKPLFDLLTCILHQTTLDEAKNKLLQNGERYLKTLEQISYLWQDRLDLVDKTVEISQRVEFSLDEIRYRYPRSNLPSEFTSSEYLRKLTLEGAARRFPEGISEKIKKQLEYEMAFIKELEYEDYFLTLKEICDFADSRNILFQGRGSAANSVVCYCLGLTSVSPNEIDMLFERFISKERREPPDIDIDFEHSRREEVIQHIYEKYDERHAAMVCTVIRYRSKMSLRETGKVFGFPLEKINAIIKFTGRDGIKRLFEPEIAQRFEIDSDKWNLFIMMAQQIHGFPRHLGIHSGGFLITQEPITELVPVEKATKNGRFVIQWNKDDVATLKLMKIDVLSLGMLTCLRKSFELLLKHKNIQFTLASIPQNHQPTYDMICAADTVGVFQIESRAQMNTLPRLKPQCFYDLVIQVAIVRPGPLQGGMVHPYLKRRQGLEPVTYNHDSLIPILRRTHGVPIFQEQVMKIVIEAADFSPGEADELRRIMSSAWRKRSTMESVKMRILNGFKKKGISQAYGEQIYSTIQGFANYGFPESHAASFALLTYASCYIKNKYPDVFACSILNSQPMGFYAPRVIVSEAQRHGVEVKALCVQDSSYDYTLEESGTDILSLRIGWRSLYGLPKDLLLRIESSRKTDGSFKDLADFIHRTSLPLTALMKLAAAGAFAVFNENTRELIWNLQSLSLDQESFLWGHPKEQFKTLVSEDLPEDNDESLSENLPFESNWDRLRREYDSKGFSADSHPLGILRSYLNEKNAQLIAQRYVPYCHSERLPKLKNKAKVRLGGLICITQRPPTAKGMCFITLEDEFGLMNIVIPPDIYQKYREVIYTKSLIEIHGQIEKVGTLINVKAERVLALQ